jgi:cytochrome d ubiquinol oxidase subunit II
MEDVVYWLPIVWAAVLGVAVALYVVLDGFDLGLGILFPAFPEEDRRDVMMNSVAPYWDGNETWLVLGGGGLLVAFPKAYAVIMPALYLPVIIMLLALVFRGVAFEYRWVAKPNHSVWDRAFTWGSTIAAFMQGVILGTLLSGITVSGESFAGEALDWLHPFPIVVGLSVVAGYGLLGATWLIMKTEGDIAAEARRIAPWLLLAVLLAMAVVSLWTPVMSPAIAERWFSMPNLILLSPVPLLTAATAYACWRGLARRSDALPFASAVALFLLGFLGLAISNAPYLVPRSMTVWQAAAAPSSQVFMLIGTLVLLPVILGYTVFVYWTFRGKIGADHGYH